MKAGANLKIAVVGKGGVGKTTVAGALCRIYAAQGLRVLAVDADPDANLASALPLDGRAPEPLARRRALIRAAAGGGELPAGLFLLNPDTGYLLPEGTVRWAEGCELVVLGWGKSGGEGCYCAENAVLRRLLSAAAGGPADVVIVDSEAGLEHMSRGTVADVDAVLAVIEPGFRSVETAYAIRRLADDLGIAHAWPVLCGHRDAGELELMNELLAAWPPLVAVPYADEVRAADLHGRPPALAGDWADALHDLALRLLNLREERP
ncbi:MAG: AAA family ATPase [Rhodocyclaceae bacterium]|nr:AAA family ATPase [Rhodocyclaceae bacterium]